MRTIAFLLLMFSSSGLMAQKWGVEKSLVSFYSHAPIEDIRAENVKSVSIFDVPTQEIAFVIPMKDFVFEKTLMQEHFNEKYLETEKYPKATFQGKVTGYDPKVETSQKATAQGKLSIHGVTREVEIEGTLEPEGKRLVLKSTFVIVLEDYKITRPQLLWQNLAEQVEVKIEFTYKPL